VNSTRSAQKSRFERSLFPVEERTTRNEELIMAYAFRRQNKGSPSFTGMYMGPDGNRRSAGTFASRRAALRAAQREEQAVLEGRWRDQRLGR
jgi:hypothetical protein